MNKEQHVFGSVTEPARLPNSYEEAEKGEKTISLILFLIDEKNGKHFFWLGDGKRNILATALL